MIIEGFSPFSGQHCETTTTGSLLKHLGLELSEPMLFGIGEGLGFIYWDMKNMPFPFIGGRNKPGALTLNIANHLGLQMDVKETSSTKIAWEQVKNNVERGIPVGLKLDSYHLDYFSQKVHFAAHYVAMYGYDDQFAYLVDTVQQGGMVKASLENIALARNEKGSMSSKNLSYTLRKHEEMPDLKDIIKKAIKKNAHDFLNPPIKNMGYRGIEKASFEITKWFKKSKNIEEDFKLTALLMERAGTGGAIFRNIYRDFLKESLTMINDKNLESAYNMFSEIAPLWTEVASLINKAGESQEMNFLNQASSILLYLSKKEYEAMEQLSMISVIA